MGVQHATGEEGSRLRAQAGVTLLEALIALLLLMVVALGLVPVFTRSIASNAQGNSSTTATNLARSQMEALLQVRFDAAALAVPAATTARTSHEYLAPASARWAPGEPPPGAAALWRRTVEVRQYAASDLLADGALDTPLDGSAPAAQVQLKEIRVRVRSGWPPGSPLGPPVDLTLAAVRAI